MSSQLPTVDDVARAAGVSRQTVSNVLNRPEVVRPATRDRVLRSIEKLRYRPHAAARRLRTRKALTLAIRMMPSQDGLAGALLDRFLHALTGQADDRGVRILLYTAESPEAETAQFCKLSDGADIDAFVLTDTFFGDGRAEFLAANDIPFVSFGRPWGADLEDPRHRWVDVDGRAGVQEATEELLARGCRRIAFLGWPEGSATGEDRRNGWEDAFRGPEAVEAVFAQGPSGMSEDEIGAARAAARALFSDPERPDAVVCASDALAVGVVLEAAELGLADLPVVGFDNTPLAAAFGFSSIDQNLDLVAGSALELLFGAEGNTIVRGVNPPGGSHRLITPSLVLRASLLSVLR